LPKAGHRQKQRNSGWGRANKSQRNTEKKNRCKNKTKSRKDHGCEGLEIRARNLGGGRKTGGKLGKGQGKKKRIGKKGTIINPETGGRVIW